MIARLRKILEKTFILPFRGHYKEVMMMQKKENGVSRRDVIKGAAAGAGILAFGQLGAGISRAAQPPQKWDKETDVVVIGYGAAGAASAIAAKEAGANVLIIDKASVPGGASQLSGGIIYAADTAIQKQQGVEDSADAMIKYFEAANRGLMDKEILRTMADNSADVINWLMELGMKEYQLQIAGAEDMPEFERVTPAVKRAHVIKGLGRKMMEKLRKAVSDRNIEENMRVEAKELISDPVRNIMGVLATGRDKKDIAIKAHRGVIICAGGYSFNKELVRSFAAMFTDAVPVGDPHSTGDGMIIGAGEGAALTCFGGPELAVGLPGLVYGPGRSRHIRALFLYANPVVFVDQTGNRFANESSYYAHLTPMVAAQRNASIIFDNEVYRKVEWPSYIVGSSPELKEELASGVIKKADTIKGLATMLDIDPNSLEVTLNAYNEAAKNGKDPQFGKTKALGPVNAPPFYGGSIGATMLQCYGGLKINNKAQVIDVFGNVIPRLYAAGAVTGTVYTYPGSGTLLNTCFVFGRLAGKLAAEEKTI